MISAKARVFGLSVGERNHDDSFVHFDTITECDRRTDGRTDGQTDISVLAIIPELA